MNLVARPGAIPLCQFVRRERIGQDGAKTGHWEPDNGKQTAAPQGAAYPAPQ